MKDIAQKVGIERNQGELRLIFNEALSGRITFEELGLTDEDLVFESGLIRMVFDFEPTNGNRSFSQIPTVEFAYRENMGETHWISDFNGTTILDKLDHRGHSTIMLMNRDKIESLEQHHKNELVVHAEFPEAVHVLNSGSYVHFFN